MRDQIIQKIKEEKLIAIVRGIKPELCLKVAQALYDGGVRLVEITYNQKDPASWLQTAEAIQSVAEEFEGRMFVGAGTVTNNKSIPTTELYDVVVCGGGPAGIGAAVAAAESGAKTAIIERFSFFGGMATAGYVNPMSEFAYNGRRISGGIPWRFANEMVDMGGARVEEPRCNISFDPEVYKLAAYRMISKDEVE